MTEESPLDRAFRAHDAFEPAPTGYAARSTPFEAVAVADRSGDEGEDYRVRVTVRVPTLSAAVEGEVGDAVAEGWFETLELRLEDAYDVTRAGEGDPPVVERDPSGGEVTAEFGVRAADPDRAVDDAAAVVDFVEGTYVQGVIPGYDYRDPVAGLLAEARRAGGGGGAGNSPGPDA